LSSFLASTSPIIARSADTGLVFLLCATPIVMAISPALIGVVVSLYAMAWLAVSRAQVDWRGVIVHPALWALLGIVIYGALSSAWAVDPERAIARAWKFLLVMAPLVMLLGRDKVWQSVLYPRALVMGIAVAAALLVVQTQGDFLLRSWISGIKPLSAAIKLNVPIAALAILGWCLPCYWSRRGDARAWSVVAIVAFGLIALSVLSGDGLAPRLAMLVGAAVWVSAYFRPRVVALLIGLGVVVVHVLIFLVPPRVYQDQQLIAQISDRSIQHRIDVWDTVGTMIRERPLLGYGMDSSRAIRPRREISSITGTLRAVPMYPHNVLLQAQLELGIVGVGAFYTCLFYLLRRSVLFTRTAGASALAMIAAGLAIWCVGYPLWRSTWIAWLGFCALAVCVMNTPIHGDRR
jgi:exopolysaccharide production protein ExoQ